MGVAGYAGLRIRSRGGRSKAIYDAYNDFWRRVCPWFVASDRFYDALQLWMSRTALLAGAVLLVVAIAIKNVG